MRRTTLALTIGVLLMTVPDEISADGASGRTAARLLTDFTAEGPDLGWYVVNDGVMGGRSRGGFTREGAVLRFAGSTNTNGGGFSSIRTKALRLDLSAYDGIRVRVRGDGRRYTWRLTTNARWRGRTVSYWADFDTSKGAWVEARIPFKRFRPQFRGRQLTGLPLDPARITGMGLMIYDKKDGPFELRLDNAHAYADTPAFSLSQYRGRRRVLVLSAPSARDENLRTQRVDVTATRKAFDERDMEVVVLLDGGAGRAGASKLSAEEVVAVRRSLKIDGSAFALRLIGKDGTVKKSSSTALPMKSIYGLIDSMPMRRAEVRESRVR